MNGNEALAGNIGRLGSASGDLCEHATTDALERVPCILAVGIAGRFVTPMGNREGVGKRAKAW
jgi:hypothetical protein